MFVDVRSARLFFDVVGEGLDAGSPDMKQRPTMILLPVSYTHLRAHETDS